MINSIQGGSPGASTPLKHNRRFAKMDKNGDGGLDESELAGMAKRTGKSASQLLSEMDTNQDGKVDSGEMRTAMEKRRAASGQAPDAAGQFTTALMNILKQLQGGSTGGSDGSSDAFSKMDTDGDGKLTPAEFAAGSAKQKSDGDQGMASAAKEFTSSLMNLFNQLQGSGQGGGAANPAATASAGTTGQGDMVAQFQQALKNGFSFTQTTTTEMTTLQSIG
ncbi:MAG: EF-hand domain-containing protein [Fibrobacteres bacterium]|nr:EF-hand domain-containing protein [Fibrobacterota bacterium]